jgi:multimeric flavodoxin WrbA
MRALLLNGTLKRSPEPSSTEALARYVGDRLAEAGLEVEHLRLADHRIDPGVVSEAVADGDEWPAVHAKVAAADVVVLATPTWLGQPGSVIKRALERLDAILSETQPDGATPLAFNKVAGVVVTGNEDGAHHVIAELVQAAVDLGFTVPGQAWTYWNKGPGPGEEVYLTASDEDKAWTHTTGDAMAHVLVHAARALAAQPIPAPPNA